MDKLFDLIILAKAGNEIAIEKIINDFEGLIKSYSRDNFCRTNEDCEQELAISFIRAIEKFELRF